MNRRSFLGLLSAPLVIPVLTHKEAELVPDGFIARFKDGSIPPGWYEITLDQAKLISGINVDKRMIYYGTRFSGKSETLQAQIRYAMKEKRIATKL